MKARPNFSRGRWDRAVAARRVGRQHRLGDRGHRLPDLVIRRARPIPTSTQLDRPTDDSPVDIVIVDGVVRDIGHSVVRPAGVPEVDADGRWAIPGLWDKHAHLGQWAATGQRLDLGGRRSPEEVLAAVTARLRVGSGRPVLGAGMRAGSWRRPVNVAELEGVSGAVPVILINADLHHAWCNTAALDALGLARRDGVVTET